MKARRFDDRVLEMIVRIWNDPGVRMDSFHDTDLGVVEYLAQREMVECGEDTPPNVRELDEIDRWISISLSGQGVKLYLDLRDQVIKYLHLNPTKE